CLAQLLASTVIESFSDAPCSTISLRSARYAELAAWTARRSAVRSGGCPSAPAAPLATTRNTDIHQLQRSRLSCRFVRMGRSPSIAPIVCRVGCRPLQMQEPCHRHGTCRVLADRRGTAGSGLDDTNSLDTSGITKDWVDSMLTRIELLVLTLGAAILAGP